MFDPIATYRIQFHKDFTFNDLLHAMPYLQQLGIGTLYASPVFESTPGSTHGYDTLDPLRINPEIGTLDQLRHLSHLLQQNGIGWLQDIVPNHMAYHPANKWLNDVMQKGRQSEYASFFDIDWEHPRWPGKVLLPVLDAPLGDLIRNKHLQLAWQNNHACLKLHDTMYPLQQQLAQAFGNEEAVHALNEDHAALEELARNQYYHLAHWRETDKYINYRRFFTVNGLICLNAQDEKLFDAFHAFIKQLLDEGLVKGLRVDHIDGLDDPAAYLANLRRLAGDETYVVVEKILQANELMPASWPVQGSTGYDFLGMVNNVLSNGEGEKKLDRFYRKLNEDEQEVEEALLRKKEQILYLHMNGELENLLRLFEALFPGKTLPENMKRGIGQFLVHCPVYRYYGNIFPLGAEEAQQIKELLACVAQDAGLEPAARLLCEALLEKPQQADAAFNAAVAAFYKRCMQFSGPLMAKGVEDTLMYTWNRFIAHNEVGDSPLAMGMPVNDFHSSMQERAASSPLAMNGTSTHDTKRGEDTRARLQVLSSLVPEWRAHIEAWREMNASLKQNGAPSLNDEYFIYQALLGAYPMRGTSDSGFAARFAESLTKAMREAKVHSGWAEPNTAYEEATQAFVAGMLQNGRFLNSFETLLQKVEGFGIVHSLAQVLLKFTCPGVPDVYQGCELWDLSFVDPDNRRPVDYDLRRQLLETLGEKPDLQELWKHRNDGRIKLWLTKQLLKARHTYKELYEKGSYIPLAVTGKYKNNVLAYARRHGREWQLCVVPLHTAALMDDAGKLPAFDWDDTAIVLPKEAELEYTSLLTGAVFHGKRHIALAALLGELPIALLQSKATGRSAGILLHLTSLPSAFGIGDMGPEAHQFAQFLARSKQQCWQLLPINPIKSRNSFSPYSSTSGMAGNILLISPELLQQEGLLTARELHKHTLPASDTVDFFKAETNKHNLLDSAYERFCKGGFDDLNYAFEEFCKKEAYWLHDYALYVVTKELHNGDEWYRWPEELKMRNAEALEKLRQQHAAGLRKVQWMQFTFLRQWRSLRSYCSRLGVQLLGDLPFYLAYDSADVWASPGLFTLDEQNNITGVAGVPPDYFSKTGQLWGMPTYNWQRLKEQGYHWWITRIKKNLEMFDLLRIDHFRAFAAYWEVPAGEETAVHGKWIEGPADDFFHAMKQAFGKLPFVAEDLGDNMDEVYALRQRVGLPGMRVLQFGFGDNSIIAVDAPHNFASQCIVYTGTHDNNTILGWFRNELGKQGRKKLEAYTGQHVTEKNIHLVMGQMAYASVAAMAILPAQDLLGLDESKRMNIPGTAEGNWRWRLQPGQLNEKIEKRLRRWVNLYGR